MQRHHLILLLAACWACRPAPHIVAPADGALEAPDGSTVPAGELGASIVRGHAILLATRDSLPAAVGSTLRCTSCHLHDGRDSSALPLTGVYARFPQYRARSGAVERIEDRINDCLVRSLNGKPLPFDASAMRDMVAYLAFISRGVPVGEPSHEIATGPTSGDTTRGSALYQQTCARCHAADGRGQEGVPPLWGAASFNIGAGMARLRTAAAFIHNNMPYDQPGLLTADEARDVAAYVTTRSRPDLPGKELDWPRGDAPADAPYPTRGSTAPH